METIDRANADERCRGGAVGLSVALEGYFDKQIQATKRTGSQPCPGEDICQQIGPLAKYPDAPIETVCGGCAKRDTKPGNQPRGYANAIAEALGLDELKEIGATFAYPDALLPFQWESLRALERARQRERDRAQAAQQQQQEQARLQARLGR